MDAIRVESLSKSFGGLEVLKDVSFCIESSKRVAVIGPNGAGKTTLLKLLTGELEPSAGQIYLFERDVTRLATHRRIHYGLACSCQITSLFPSLSVLDNVLLACQGMRATRYDTFRSYTAYPELLTRSREVLGYFELWPKRSELVKNLSHGEQRNMELALCLASHPKLLLLDEPSAGLPTSETPRLISILKNLPRNLTLLFVAHDMDIVFNLADEVMVLYYGTVIARGTPQQIQADAKVREIYLGSNEAQHHAQVK